MDLFKKHQKHWREYLVLVLITSNIFVWVAVYERGGENNLKVYFLDVGQGDATYIVSPGDNHVLIDGGYSRKVLSELGKVMPFGDRRIDVLIATHPDADHIGGLPEVVRRYDVGVFIKPDVESDNSIDDELDEKISSRGVETILAKRGIVLDLGRGAELQILYPNQDVSGWDINDASVVTRLSYRDETFLFTGDASIKVENVITILDGEALDVDVLKVGHHGSRTSTLLSFAELASPEYAVISAGLNNRYGHPHQEVLDTLASVGAEVLNTANLGTIRFETDGETLKVK